VTPVDFIQTLAEIRGGKAAINCNRKFGELVAAIQETGGKGKIVVELTVTPARLEGGRVTEITVDPICKITRPEPKVGSSSFFITDDGGLSRDDPAQIAMFETEGATQQ
jgi:hypothetical protein